jgi:chemotaxis signal transduction protein
VSPSRANELARAFDEDFARPIAPRAVSAEDLLAIRIGADPYAMVRGELGGLFADRPVTLLPGDTPGLLGISGFRGALVPVYDLIAVIGGSRATTATPRWLVVAAGVQVALAFDHFEAYARVPREAIATEVGAAAGHARRAARFADELRPILDVASIVESLRARARARNPP